jgi:hypothetical protein
MTDLLIDIGTISIQLGVPSQSVSHVIRHLEVLYSPTFDLGPCDPVSFRDVDAGVVFLHDICSARA